MLISIKWVLTVLGAALQATVTQHLLGERPSTLDARLSPPRLWSTFPHKHRTTAVTHNIAQAKTEQIKKILPSYVVSVTD